MKKMAISKKNRIVELVWFNPMNTVFYDKSNYSLIGKGYGCCRDIETGETLFLYGQEIGGGMYGEDADPVFLEVGCLYNVTESWVKNDINDRFFMGLDFRIKKISTLEGKSPNNYLLENVKKKLNFQK